MPPSDLDYPEFPKTTTPASESALLHNCMKDRMLAIAKDLYSLTGLSRLNKEDIFKAVYNHMLTIDDCDQCDGDCNPIAHEFPPYTVTTPETSLLRTPQPKRWYRYCQWKARSTSEFLIKENTI